MVDIKTYMSGLSIEITRKCNMNCIFCSRGDSQNLTISKSIIDKTLLFLYYTELQAPIGYSQNS